MARFSKWSSELPGIDPARFDALIEGLRAACAGGRFPAAGVVLGRSHGTTEPRLFGSRAVHEPRSPIEDDTLFLVASLTKPIVAMAVVLLVERGQITLDDRVADFLPAFHDARPFKHEVRLRHLLTHTSGLPDMTPSNRAFREAHAPLDRFVEEMLGLPLAFRPGTRVSYQSTGFALLGEVVRVVSGEALPTFLRRHLFEPLNMRDTALGCPAGREARVAEVRLEADTQGTDWHWNTPYWLGFGAPWGGLITSLADQARFCRMMLRDGELDGVRVFSPGAVRMATRNQLLGFSELPESERQLRSWGLGWRRSWPGSSAQFGDMLGPSAFGHWGATGTLCWMDPERDQFLVLFTTQPGGDEGRDLARFSNSASAAFA